MAGLRSRVFRGVNWLGVLLLLPLLFRVLIFASDLPHAVEWKPIVLFVMAMPVLAVIGLLFRQFEWLGVVGLLVTLPWASSNLSVGGRTAQERIAFTAASKGDAATLRQALAAGVDPDLRDNDGVYLLAHAAGAGNPEVTRALIDAGARVNARKGRASAPLLHAVLLLRCPSAVALLQAGADPDERLLDFGDLALGEEYRDISARALHELNKKAYTKLMGDRACWSAFENLLQKPRDARSTLASMWESLRGLY